MNAIPLIGNLKFITIIYKRITNKDIVDYLIKICNKEKVKFESEALDIIANKADGAMRDALSIFDRILSYNNKEITVKDVSINLNVLDQEIYSNTIDLILENILTLLTEFRNNCLSIVKTFGLSFGITAS